MKKWGLILVVIMIASVVAISGCSDNKNATSTNTGSSSASGSSGSSGSSASGSSSAGSGNLQIINSQLVAGSYGSYSVKGSARNVGNAPLSYAEVDAKFYDASGALLTSGLDNVNNLGSNEIWNFEVPFTGQGTPTSYQITSTAH